MGTGRKASDREKGGAVRRGRFVGKFQLEEMKWAGLRKGLERR